jgi:hypothetical protein
MGVGTGGDVHGDIVRDDGLLLELKLLEGIGLKDRLGDCDALELAVWDGSCVMDVGDDVRLRMYLMAPKIMPSTRA